MTDYVWYNCLLSCGHEARTSDFESLPPKIGAERWCGSCREGVVIKSISRHVVEIEDIEEMPG